ncbi:MAG: leucine-rich repeat domain-containing protein [Muribaculaceae bacterium]|nr:leucine-rich repeat domain-containing protein [Muribaculaceae bacterium]
MQLRYLAFISIIAVASRAWGLSVTTLPGELESHINVDPSTVTTLTVRGSINAVDLQYIADKMTMLRTLNLSNATIAAYQGDALITGAGTASANELAPYSLAGLKASSISLPTTLSIIGEGALAGSKISSVAIPQSVKSIGMGAFAGCSNIDQLTIPASVTSIADYAFKDMPELTQVDIKAPITAVPPAAFAGNTKLTKVSLPSSVTSIDSAAFSGCSALSEIDLPKSVTSIGASAFRGTGLIDANLQQLNRLKNIGDWAFADNTSLSSVTLPESLTNMGSGAFFGCTSLTDINVPTGVTEIADYTFTGATAMKATHLNDYVETIGDFALQGWDSSEFTFPVNLTYIGDGAMENWASATKFTALITSVPELGTDVWSGVDQAKVKLFVPVETIDEYKDTPQWQDFDIIVNTGVEDVIADASGAITVNGYFSGYDLIVESSTDIALVEVYNAGGLKLTSVEPAHTMVTIDTEGWSTPIFIVRVILSDSTPATLKLARH